MTKEALATIVRGIILDHQVSLVVSYVWGKEYVPYCTSCAYLGNQEDVSLHTANVLLEYLEEYYKERFSNDESV